MREFFYKLRTEAEDTIDDINVRTKQVRLETCWAEHSRLVLRHGKNYKYKKRVNAPAVDFC
jgi:hypothetical protein